MSINTIRITFYRRLIHGSRWVNKFKEGREGEVSDRLSFGTTKRWWFRVDFRWVKSRSPDRESRSRDSREKVPRKL